MEMARDEEEGLPGVSSYHLNTNPEFRGESAGTNIADEVNPQAITAMKEIGIVMTDKTKYFPIT